MRILHRLRVVFSYVFLVVLGFLLVTGGPVVAQKLFVPVLYAQNSQGNFLEEGRVLYEGGRFFEAIKVWQQAEKIYEKQGDFVKQILVLNYVSNAYQALGEWEAANTAIEKCLKLLDKLEESSEKNQVFARVLMSQGSLQLAMGQVEMALSSWQMAEKLYKSLSDEIGVLGSQVNQSQALQSLGLYRGANSILEKVYQVVKLQPDSLLKASSLQSLGVALQVVGDLQKSQEVLQESFAILLRLNAVKDQAVVLLSLANTSRSLKDFPKALEYYHKTTEIATDLVLKIEARVNELSLLMQLQNWEAAIVLSEKIKSDIRGLPPSRSAVYAQINFAQSLMKMPENKQSLKDLAKLLANAVQQAKTLQDKRAESYALFELGFLYKTTGQFSEARSLTQQSIALAEAISAEDIIARAQANLGQILKEQGEILAAIKAYKESVKNLTALRRDLVAINQDVQFSFQESVEPVYRELVSLLLDPSASPNNQVSQENLKQARLVIEALQLAELDNFFREACLDAKPQQVEQFDSKAAVIYPIILADRLEVILSLPGKPLQYYSTRAPASELQNTLDEFYQSFNLLFPKKRHLQLAQQLYTWLVAPAQKELAASGIKTLVFVPDVFLRNLPMGALYDGEHYLIEKYSLAITPGLQLLPPQTLEKSGLKALTAGLTEARQGFGALPAVKLELESIASQVPGTVFLNQQFTEKQLQEKLVSSSYPVVHLATHGQFSSNPEETFILTWDEKIKVREFESLLRSGGGEQNAIELLVLSACQTASGDRRAALGLAGVALRSGARSTVGTLWSVQDLSTAKFMSDFYEQLTISGVSKAAALRHAQLYLLQQHQFEHPFYWAPFILVGNWL